MRRLTSLILLLSPCLGCSTDVTDIFMGSGGGGGAGTTSASGRAITSAAGPAATGGTTTTSGKTSASGTSATGMTTGSGATSSASATSSSSGGTLAQVYCNGAPCAPGEVCCFNPNGPGDHCGTHNQCNGGTVELGCNGPEDCPGQICCATVKNQTAVDGISCRTSCSTQEDFVVCSAADPGVCAPGTQCNPVNQLGAGYRLCF